MMVPVYHRWAKVPPDLTTRTSLRRQRLAIPATVLPVASFESSWGTYDLFAKTDAVPVPYKRPPKDYPQLFAARYADPRAAYVAACEALFQINRFAKHEECRYWQRREIYRLKDRWTARLWEEGFCIGAIRVFSPRKELPCWDCGGGGDNPDRDFYCYKCEGTGIYRTVGGRAYWALRYQVDGKQFFWHQPEDRAMWAEARGQEEPHEVVITEKSIKLAQGKFTEAKALMLWLLGPEPAPEPAPAPIPIVQSLRNYWTRDWQPVAVGDTLDPEEIPF